MRYDDRNSSAETLGQVPPFRRRFPGAFPRRPAFVLAAALAAFAAVPWLAGLAFDHELRRLNALDTVDPAVSLMDVAAADGLILRRRV
ncbi:MAG: hypothetical protein ACRDD1_13805, partial [Planctomycetia bacterium]